MIDLTYWRPFLLNSHCQVIVCSAWLRSPPARKWAPGLLSMHLVWSPLHPYCPEPDRASRVPLVVKKHGIINISLLRDRGSHHEKYKHLVWLLTVFRLRAMALYHPFSNPHPTPADLWGSSCPHRCGLRPSAKFMGRHADPFCLAETLTLDFVPSN